MICRLAAIARILKAGDETNPAPQSRRASPISKEKILIFGLVAVAFVALVLGATYQNDSRLAEPVIVGDDESSTDTTAQSAGGRVINEDGSLASKDDPTTVNPIEEFLPVSPTGANCREPVGVDLIPGYAASLVINGQRVPPEDMNGANPETGAIPAGRTQGRYTYGPEDGCPNGALLRPRSNTVQACVYKIEDGPETCSVSEFTFNAL